MANNKNNNKKKPGLWSRMVLLTGKIKLYLIAATVIVVIIASAYLVRQCRNGSITTYVNDSINITPTQVLAMKEIGEWEFLSIDDEEMVDTTRKKLFGSDDLIRIYKGTLRIGIDLGEASENWVTVSGDTLRAVLPKVKLLDDDFIDEAQTQSFFESGTWDGKARNDLYLRAKAKMKKRCLTKENLESAEDNASKQFYQMFKAMGFNTVEIRFEK